MHLTYGTTHQLTFFLSRLAIEKLEIEIENLKEKHGEAIDILESELSEKERMMNETDSKMSMISIYVDQLEERLVSFAILRREITEREVTCQELEEKDLELREELKNVQNELDELKTESTELKKLSALLVEERVILQEDKQSLTEEKDALISEKESLSKDVTSLKDNFEEVKAELEATVTKFQDIEQEVLLKDKSINILKEESAAQLSDREEKLGEAESLVSTLEANIDELKLEKEKATELIALLEKEIEENVERFQRFDDENKQKEVEGISICHEADGSDTITCEHASEQSEWEGDEEAAAINCAGPAYDYNIPASVENISAADSHIPPPPSSNHESDTIESSVETSDEVDRQKVNELHQDFGASEDYASNKIQHNYHTVYHDSDYPPPPPPLPEEGFRFMPPPPEDFEGSRQHLPDYTSDEPEHIFVSPPPPPTMKIGNKPGEEEFAEEQCRYEEENSALYDVSGEAEYVFPPPPPPPPPHSTMEMGMEIESNSVEKEEFVEEQDCSGVDDSTVYERHQTADIIFSSEHPDHDVPIQSHMQPETPYIDEITRENVFADNEEETHGQITGEIDEIQKEVDNIITSDECESSDVIDLDVPELQTQGHDMPQKSEELSDFNLSEKLLEESENPNEEITSGNESSSVEPEFPDQTEVIPDLFQQSTKRSVPFRRPRKLFARITGVHGAFTKPSSKTKKPKR